MAKPWAKSIYNGIRWHRARAEALRRDRYTCRSCHARAEEVHHIIELTPDNITDDHIVYGQDNLMSLCWRCHQGETFRRGDVAEGFKFDENGQVVPQN